MASDEAAAAELSVTSQDFADCRVVVVAGRIDHTNSQVFQETLERYAHGVPAGGGMVNDLAKLEFITSAGLRALLLADRQIKSGGGKFIVSGIDGVVKEVFRISKFDALLSVTETAAEGVAQVSPAAAEAYPD